MDLKAAGAPFRLAGSYTLARMVACGQTIAHLLHWMQSASSQTGISRAMFRFSHCAVAVAKVPSTGKAETGRLSPRLPRSEEAGARQAGPGGLEPHPAKYAQRG